MRQSVTIGVLVWVFILISISWVYAGPGKKIKWVTVEKAWIKFKVSGDREGEIIRQYADFGNKQSEINNTVMRMMGMEIPENKKVITEGKMVTTWKKGDSFAQRTQNPMYDAMVKRMNTSDGKKFGERLARAMGGKYNGKTRVVAKQPCREMVIQQFGMNVCVTREGLAVRSEANFMGTHFVEEATMVKIGHANPADFKFAIGIEIRESPSLGGGLGALGRPGSNKSMRESEKMPDRPTGAVSDPGSGQPGSPPDMGQMQESINKLMEMFKPKSGQ